MKKTLATVACALAVVLSLSIVPGKKLGILGVDVVSAATGETPGTNTKTTYSTSSTISRVLKSGSKGNDVKTLQTLLNSNGYKLSVDGIFGNLTLTAVKDYQGKNGLAVDGMVGPKTLAKISPATTSTTTTTSSQITRLLKLGSKGDDVKLLQTWLNNNGNKLSVDGIFGNLTLAAVKDYQSKNGLAVDGLVGPKTIAKITPAATTPATPTTPAAPTTPTTPPVDTVASASVVKENSAFEKAISKDGKWIIATLNDLTFNKPLVLDGQFLNGKTDSKTGLKTLQRKIALYTQDDKRNVTARFTLTAPKLTIMSTNASIQHGTFKGDLYVSVPDFQLVDTKVEGNVYFTTKSAQDTFVMDDKSSITGKKELQLLKEVDVVATASLVNDKATFENAIGKNGKWIISVLNNLTFDKELVLDGEFKNTKNPPAVQRKIALYSQDSSHATTARFTLKAPKLTINSPMASIQKGMFKGDLYVTTPNFQLVDAVIDGNVYFATQQAKDTFKPDATSIITGKQDVKAN
ncbi:peptidoglycan-binding protein [Clostridium sp. YIM B02515]|uniref:Peptidoglycan-binding protein n=1 Tax=Clostridium rhizosphaerae TaxID=2803861 RepID=A0ABS1TA91_9CLOT|nr:peptidoglycan-binding protein [Clostridium rhizosphaerae]MBL4936260.1 peptidoglycan-binding protein [Clostridium rhizosphaerae]